MPKEEIKKIEQKPQIHFSHPQEEEGQDAWLMSYADMITLLFGFFVVLLSMSTINPIKVEMFSQYFSKSETRMTMTQLNQVIEKFITNQNIQNEVNSKLTLRGVEISFKDKLLFDIGKADLKSEVLSVMAKMADLLKQEQIRERKISIEGHTDSLPIRSPVFPTNWELSSSRASSVVRFFINQGLENKRFESIGYADTKPVNSYTHPTFGQPENRRVVVIISPESYLEETERKEIQTVSTNPSDFKKLTSEASVSTSEQTTQTTTESTSPTLKETLPLTTEKKQETGSSGEFDTVTKKKLMEKHYTQGIAYIKQGKKDLAIKEFKEILKLDPKHQPSLQRIAILKKQNL